MHYKYLFCLLLAFFLSVDLIAQATSDVEFGKNRVQYHQDFEEWSQYESDNFTTYWYGEGRFVGEAAVMLAEYDFKNIEEILEHKMNTKIEIIVYSDLSDFEAKQYWHRRCF